MLTLTELSHGEAVTARLKAAGLSHDGAAAVGAMAAGTVPLFLAGGSVGRSVHAFWVPGRVEVLGKHTDYAGGSSLLAATEQGFLVVAAPREDATVHVHALDLGEEADFALDPKLTPTLGGWRNYPMTVARRLARNFPDLAHGADIAFTSSIPIAAGMSSSSALMIGIYLALAAANDLARSAPYRQNVQNREQLAEYLGTVENGQSYGTLAGDRGVGTFGGSEDHTAILCCQAGQLSRYRYCPTRFERALTLPAGYTFAIAASGVVADKTGSAREKYNRASALAVEVTSVWNEATGNDDLHMAVMVARCGGDPAPILAVLDRAKSRQFSSADLRRRFLHFFCENEELIPAATAALAAGDIAGFGVAANRSQAEGVRLLGNQIAETEALAALALQRGAVAASAFGAGFGGSVWALVREDGVEPFLAGWSADYLGRFPQHQDTSRFFQTRPGPSAAAI